ncbi:hypothetical protein HYFRA_00010069 [Hymenoscyphus fraxineus]|uniref:Extracellular membrane protein CFEM domain-containing protein n=1 Tax=Hymenoscyphus fraxineus TaxID=746836 RepID=A0A9N9KWW8_9HELO|nr:hypothetical protein HYFRA_00010069 [Hymenoscyphus fraxineus]
MPQTFQFAVAAAVIAFGAPSLATDCTATVTVISTVTAYSNTCQMSSSCFMSSSTSSSLATSAPTISTSSVTSSPTIPATTTPLDCQPDNCLRHFQRFSNDLSPFCATYTTSVSTATSFPSIVENCDSNPSRVSSACSCINTSATPPPTISSTSTLLSSTTSVGLSSTASTTTTADPPLSSLDCQPDNCLRHFDGHSSELAPFCATYTTSPSTATVFPSNVVNCDNYQQVSSACSCINTKFPGAIGYTSTTQSMSSTVSGNSGVTTPTASTSSACSVSVIFETRTEVTTVFTTVSVTSESFVTSTSESTSSSFTWTSPETSSAGWSEGWGPERGGGFKEKKGPGGPAPAALGPWGRFGWRL